MLVHVGFDWSVLRALDAAPARVVIVMASGRRGHPPLFGIGCLCCWRGEELKDSGHGLGTWRVCELPMNGAHHQAHGGAVGDLCVRAERPTALLLKG